MRLLLGLFLLVPLSGAILPCQPYQVTLQTTEGKPFPLKLLKTAQASVFVFLLPDCPACQSYSLTLNDLYRKYKSQSIEFTGVVPGEYCTTEEIRDFVRTYKMAFPVVMDTANKLVRCLGATIVPEVFVVDSLGKTLYAGRIDDWMVAVGRKRKVITANDLKNALAAVTKKQPVKVQRTKAIGCFIEIE